jgi:Integrase core domain
MKLFPPSAAFEFVAMDILGPLPKTAIGNRYILVIVDRFSKLTRAIPMRSILAEDVAKLFVEDWYCLYGPPLVLLTDNGTQFVSKFFKTMCKVLGVRQVFTTAYHPSTNGQCERFNRTALEAIIHYVSANQDNWDELVHITTYAYNTTVHSSTGYTPFELTFGHDTPSHVLGRTGEYPAGIQEQTKASYRQSFLRRCQKVGKDAKETLTERQERYKKGL